MRRSHAALLLMLGFPLLLGISPLTESERVRVETADDHSLTVDESALYALLENAVRWQDTEADAVVPDWDRIRDDPEAYRAKPLLVEGVLAAEFEGYSLRREGWESIKAVIIHVNPDERPLREATADDFVIAFLTHPPELNRPTINLNQRMLKETGQPVRLVARFFKLLDTDSERGEFKTYPVVVGRTMKFSDRASGSQTGGGGGGVAPVALVGVLLLAGIVYLFWRLRNLGKGSDEPSKMEQYRAQRAEARRLRGDPEDIEEETLDLPEDPADALDSLSRKDQESQS